MKHDFFKLAEDKVEQILKKHNIDIHFKDDDTFADFMVNVEERGFTFAEKQILYTYNCMLQTIAFSVEDVKFIMVVE